ncbi:MAG: multidrug effflux MFS transporter [Gammaproteobacteria bacterium]|nr:multidrug effflux MFS transporter [Gammaproteobacteria bacterium]
MNQNLVLAILILTSSVALMSTDIYTPSLAHLPEYFGTDAATVKLTMSLNGIVYALATLLYGPLSERFGRRPVLLGGMVGFTLFSFLCGMAATIGGLIAMRVFQGLTAAVEGVLVLAIIRDVFDDRDQIRALAWYGAFSALTPATAPILGGYIYIWFGWRMTFFVVALVALVTTMLIWRFLPESAKPDVRALSLRKVIADYADLLRNWAYLRYVLIGGADLAFFFAFVTAGPFILILQHGLPTEYFGYFQGLMVLAFTAGSLIAGKLSRVSSAEQIVLIGIAASICGTLWLAVAVFGGMETPASLAVACSLIALGDGLVFATTPSLAMNASSSSTGAAAALLICIEVGLGGLAALAVGVFHDGTSRPFAWTVVALGVLMAVCYANAGFRTHASRSPE